MSSSVSVYLSPKSNNQIVSLLKTYPSMIVNIFSKILYNYLSEQEVTCIINEIKEHKDLDDKTVYDRFRKEILSREKKENDDISRSKTRVKHISSFYHSKPQSYLDLGGGDGSITSAIGRHFDLKKENIICADVESWYDIYDKKYDCTYVTINENELPFNSEEFSLVTCFQSLHHMKNLENRLKDIHRILKKGGTIIIREHDCVDDNMRMLIDIEHCIFELVLKDNQKFVNEYYANYKSKYQWTNMFRTLGFKYIQTKYPNNSSGKYNPTMYYYAMYTKL